MGNLKLEPKELLPTWDDIFKQIEYFRENSKAYNNLPKNKKSNKCLNGLGYNVTDYYNNISIIGGRGTGKTSLLIGIKEEINKNDILFDIITPDTRDKEDMLGWIISLVKKKYEQIKKEKNINTRNDYCDICNYNGDNNIERLLKELEQAYFFRKSMYENVIVNDYSSKIDYLNDNIEKLNSDVNIKSLFSEVIDNIVELKGKENNPLLIFLFDDVDIHTSKINEILMSIMNYLSHPNIVTIIAGDYDSAIENITLKMLQDDKINDYELLKLNISYENGTKSVLDRRIDRSYDMIKKVLPPSYRHYIDPLKSKSKYEIMEKSLKQANLGEGIKGILKKIREFIDYNDEGYILYDYVCFLDDTIRGCKNVAKFIISRNIEMDLKECEEKEEKSKALFEYLEDLLNVIIQSNLELEKNKAFITRVINLSKSNRLDSRGIKFNGYINYQAIMAKLNNEISEKEEIILSKKQFKLYYKIFILANFFEKLIIEFKLREDSGKINKLHGLKELTHILNSAQKTSQISLVPNLINIKTDLDESKDIQKLISIKQNLFQVLKYEEIQQLFNEDKKDSSYEYLEAVYLDSLDYKHGIIEYLEKIYYRDSKWAYSVLDYILNKGLSKDKIKQNEIKKLEDEYGYKIYEPKEIAELEIYDSYIEVWSIIDIINHSFELIEKYKHISETNKFYEDKISKKIKLRDYIKLRNEYNLEDKYNEKLYLEISRQMEKCEKFVYDEINQKMWENLKNEIYIIDDDDDRDIIITDANTIELNTKQILEQIDSDNEYFENSNFKKIIIKNNLNINEKNFIKEYVEKLEVYNILEDAPLMKVKDIKKEIDNIESKIDIYNEEMEDLKRARIDLIIKFKTNKILSNLLKLENPDLDEYIDYLHNEITIDSDLKVENKEQCIKIIFENMNNILNDEKLYNEMKKCINYIINFYENEDEQYNIENYTFKIMNFKNLLDSFKEEICKLKEVDKIIELNIYSNLFNLNRSQINYYKSKLNNMNYDENEKNFKYNLTLTDLYSLEDAVDEVGDIEIERYRRRLNDRQIEHEREKLLRALSQKKHQLLDETFKLRNKLFNYAFNLTLYKYLYYKEKEYEYNLKSKVRTNYLLELTDKLRDKVNNDVKKSSVPTSFTNYLKQRLS